VKTINNVALKIFIYFSIHHNILCVMHNNFLVFVDIFNFFLQSIRLQFIGPSGSGGLHPRHPPSKSKIVGSNISRTSWLHI